MKISIHGIDFTLKFLNPMEIKKEVDSYIKKNNSPKSIMSTSEESRNIYYCTVSEISVQYVVVAQSSPAFYVLSINNTPHLLVCPKLTVPDIKTWITENVVAIMGSLTPEAVNRNITYCSALKTPTIFNEEEIKSFLMTLVSSKYSNTQVNIYDDPKKNIFELLPTKYLKIFIRDNCLIAITNKIVIRYGGAFYRLGPYEIKIPLIYNHSELKNDISQRVAFKLFNPSDDPTIILEDTSLMIDSEGRGSTLHSHPHIAAISSATDAQKACFGNFVKPISEFIAEGNVCMVLTMIHEFLSSVSHNWYSSMARFSYCSSPESFFSNNGCKCAKEDTKK